MSNIRDVPCLSCQHGYDGPHTCDAPRYCPCDRSSAHIEGRAEAGGAM